MMKSSSRIVSQRLLLITAAVALLQPSPLRAQETINSEFQDPVEIASAEPVEMASLVPLAALPEPEIAGANVATRVAFTPAVGVTLTPKLEGEHRFWDRENRILFAVAGGLAVADFCVTRANLASGGKELNPVTRILSGSTPGLAANFALETGGLISVNYLLHKSGHHKLERMTSYVNVSASAGAVVWGLSHR